MVQNLGEITMLGKNNFEKLDLNKWQSYVDKNPAYKDYLTLRAYEPRPDNYQ